MHRVPQVYQIASTFYPSIGGAQRATATLSRALIHRGFSVEVLTRWSPGLKRYEVMDDVPVRRLGGEGPGKLGSLLFGLHTLYWVLRYGRGTPLIHTQSIDTPLLVGIALSLLPGKRWVVTVHGAPRIPQKRRTFLGRLRFHLLCRLVDRVVAISSAYRRVMLDIGISPERISLIPNGLDVDFFRPPRPEEREAIRSQHGYEPYDVIVLFLGRLVLLKRVDLLLRALASLGQDDRIKCVVVGNGPEMDNLRTLAREQGVGSRVRFVGPVDNVRDFYWLSNVFVLPSRFEGLPVALLESMACGTAVLVTRCAGNLEAVTDGVTGLTCEIDNQAHLAQQLQRLADNGDLRRKLGTEARQMVLERYSMQAVAEAHLRVYTGALDGSDDSERGHL